MTKGVKLSEETRHKMSLSRLGEKNPMWKGDKKIHITTLHDWVRSRLPVPDRCTKCNTPKPSRNIDLANITGIYNREFKNWQYLCRTCHWILDEKVKNLKQYSGKGHISGRQKGTKRRNTSPKSKQ
jgi:hypothetical protein